MYLGQIETNWLKAYAQYLFAPLMQGRTYINQMELAYLVWTVALLL